MLQQRPKIFIAYGHGEDLKKKIVSTLQRLRDEKFFRISIEVVSDTSIRLGSGTVAEEVHDALSQASAAIVLLTADDLALPKARVDELIANDLKAGELADRMQKRARQNVIFELGFLRRQVGKERVYVVADKGIEMPSNIGDVFRSDPMDTNISELLVEFVEKRLGIQPEPLVLEDHEAKVDYTHLFQPGFNLDDEEILKYFEVQFRRFETNEERLTFLYERIVFDSYFQKPEWWTALFREVSPQSELESLAKDGLRLVSEYMAKWRPPELMDFDSISLIASDLEKVLNELHVHNVRPVVQMVLNDYLGLGPIDIQDSSRETVLIHCAQDQLIRSALHAAKTIRAQR